MFVLVLYFCEKYTLNMVCGVWSKLNVYVVGCQLLVVWVYVPGSA